MNILILNWRDPKNPLAGGAEESLYEHAQFWIKKGAKVTWFASYNPNGKEKEVQDSILFIRKGTHYTVHLWTLFYFLTGQLGKQDIIIDCFHFVPFFTPLYMRHAKIIALINEPGRNAWFKNIFFPVSLLGFLAEPFFFLVYRTIPFIVGSESIKKELLQYGLKDQNIHIIHHGIDTRQVSRNEKEKNPTYIYLAQIARDKGTGDAIKAFAIVAKQYSNSRLWIVGKAHDKKYLREIQNLIVSLSLENYVKFYGYISDSEKFELLAKAWILIHPSIREGWGLNVIEAASQRTPTIGYNVVGLRDSIINNKTGILVNRDYESLANEMRKLIEDKKLLQELSHNAKEWSKNFTWDKSGEKSWELIQKTV